MVLCTEGMHVLDEGGVVQLDGAELFQAMQQGGIFVSWGGWLMMEGNEEEEEEEEEDEMLRGGGGGQRGW